MVDNTIQYVGARYVPKFADPVEWKSNTYYEALTIVTFNNSSYTSKIPVPATVGNPADNGTYWVLTGNYNAQIEEYRQATEQETSNRSALIYNNSGKADVPLGLSVEGKLSANDGIDISGTIKYSTPQIKDNVEIVPFTADDGTEYGLTTSKNMLAHKLFFGDSWATLEAENQYPERTLWYHNLLEYYPNLHNYAVGGAAFSDLPSQIEQASNDNSFVNCAVDTVIIICGVNDYIRGVDYVTAGNNLNTATKAIRSHFPRARIVTLIDSIGPFTMYASLNWSYSANWEYAINIQQMAKSTVYSLAPFLSVQRAFESGGVMTYHVNKYGSNVLESVITQILEGCEPSYRHHLSNKQSYTLTKDGTSSVETTIMACDAYACGKSLIYGFAVGTAYSGTTTLTFDITDSTDYNVLLPLPSAVVVNPATASTTGFVNYTSDKNSFTWYSNGSYAVNIYSEILPR